MDECDAEVVENATKSAMLITDDQPDANHFLKSVNACGEKTPVALAE